MIEKCRACRSQALEGVVSLGFTPLANSLLTKEQLQETEATYPLGLLLCRSCSLVQTPEDIPPEDIFSDYPYLSSYSDTTVDSARDLAEKVIAWRGLNAQSRVMEIASNDGYLLQHYKLAGIDVLGIEPAANIAPVAIEKGIPTRCEFFNLELAKELNSEWLTLDVIHAHNVLAHVPDPVDFLSGIQILLKDHGVAIFEVPYIKDLMDNMAFDTIYHEHLSYFSLTALESIFDNAHLRIEAVERIPAQGGSLRIFATHDIEENYPWPVHQLLQEEKSWGVDTSLPYSVFGAKIWELRWELDTLLRQLKADGKSIAAYGASAKGSTLLNCFDIGMEIIDFVVDRSPAKQGRYTPGTHLPIYGPEKLLEEQPDYALLLSWNYAEEILGQQQAYRDSGGKFIIPTPRLAVV